MRAARVFLDWTIDDLSASSGVHAQTIVKIENADARPQKRIEEKLRSALERAGIDFLPDEGVRPRRDLLRVIEGVDPYMQLNEDIWLTLKEKRGEVLFAFVDNGLSPPEVLEIENRMRQDGIEFRSLIQEGGKINYPAREYRCLDSEDFQNNSLVIYADKVAFMINGNEKCFLIRNEILAETMRKMFNALWKKHKAPSNVSNKA